MPEIKYGIHYELWFTAWCKRCYAREHTVAEAAALPHILRCVTTSGTLKVGPFLTSRLTATLVLRLSEEPLPKQGPGSIR